MRTETITFAMLAVAKEWSHLFIRDSRDNGEEFVKTVDAVGEDHPLREAIFTAHGNMMPDDTKYRMCESAVDAIAEASEGADISAVADEFSDSEPSVYNAARLKWVSSHLDRADYVDEAVRESGTRASEFSLFDALGWGWAAEAREMFDAIAQAIEEEAERLQGAAEEKGETS